MSHPTPPSPRPRSARERARAVRKAYAELVFAWGSVVSVSLYALLTVAGRPPSVDEHITHTATVMLPLYALGVFAIDVWRRRLETRRSGARQPLR